MNLNKTAKEKVPSLGRLLLACVRESLSEEANRRDFENWYRERYGKDYDWKKGVL